MVSANGFQPCPFCKQDQTVLTSYPPKYHWTCSVCGGGYTTIEVSDLRPAPTIGRIVRYTEPRETGPGGEWPAIVTVVHPGDQQGVVSLQVFGRNAVYPVWVVSQADEPTPGCWHWPPSERAFYLPAGPGEPA